MSPKSWIAFGPRVSRESEMPWSAICLAEEPLRKYWKRRHLSGMRTNGRTEVGVALKSGGSYSRSYCCQWCCNLVPRPFNGPCADLIFIDC